MIEGTIIAIEHIVEYAAEGAIEIVPFYMLAGIDSRFAERLVYHDFDSAVEYLSNRLREEQP